MNYSDSMEEEESDLTVFVNGCDILVPIPNKTKIELLTHWAIVFAFLNSEKTRNWTSSSDPDQIDLEYIYPGCSHGARWSRMPGKLYDYCLYAIDLPILTRIEENKLWCRCMTVARSMRITLYSAESFFRKDPRRFTYLANQVLEYENCSFKPCKK